jgi:anti-anti-sigma factor
MKYHISKTPGLLLIKISGDTRKNEALPAKKVLSQHLREQGMKVIVDMEELNRVEPMALVGVLNAIRKEVRLLNGDLRLRSLRPEILSYFQVHRLDRIFQFCKNEEKDAGKRRETHGKR